MTQSSNLILGGGFIGRCLAQRLDHSGTTVVNRSAKGQATSAAQLRHARCFTADILNQAGVTALAALLGDFCGRVIFLLPPSAFADEPPVSRLHYLLEWLARQGIEQAIVVSSSAVYAEQHGGWVNVDDPVDAARPRSARLLEIEQLWRSLACPVSVVRCAGLYGPTRIIGKQSLLSAKALPGDPQQWLNVIHQHDVASALEALLKTHTPPATLLLSDAQPVRRQDYYAAVATYLETAPPVFDATNQRRGGSKRCNSRSSWEALALSPQYPDYISGLKQCFSEQPAD